MLTLFLASLLAVGPNEQVVRQGKGADGGYAWSVDCINCSGGPGGSAVYYVNALIDGGFMTVQVLNPTPAYVNALLDGGAVVATQGPGEDGGRQWNVSAYQGTSPWTVGGFANVLLDGGAVVATQGLGEDGGRAWNVALAYGPNSIGSVYLQFDAGIVTSRITGNTGAVVDAANNAAAPANVVAVGFEAAAQTTTQPTAATAGNMRRPVISTDGALYTRNGGPVTWSCFIQAVTATTQCIAAPAAGLRAYVATMNCSNQVATVQTLDVVYGTGANCATGTTALTHKFQMGTNALTTSPFQTEAEFASPLVPAAANAICVRPSAATAFGCTLTGYTAP